ncbi:hypothetical protein FD754_001993, partial [Muntiacus muntjak]
KQKYKGEVERSPAHSYSSYDSGKNESVDRGAEDLSLNRGDEDEDDHDDHEDSEKANETDGVEAERLKAFNMFVRLFVDENLDRMVPISKQPKEKIQAIIDSCRRQFPEYQERARKRIRTYLKSCRRMKRSGFEMNTSVIAGDIRDSGSIPGSGGNGNSLQYSCLKNPMDTEEPSRLQWGWPIPEYHLCYRYDFSFYFLSLHCLENLSPGCTCLDVFL